MENFSLVEQTVVEQTGKPRRVGFELEFSGLSLTDVGEIIAGEMQGEIKLHNTAECVVNTSNLGEFKVELDWQFGKEIARRRQEARQAATGKEDPDDPLMEWLTAAASEVVPVEIVCPPIEIAELDVLSGMVEGLREAGAVGTHSSPVYAFGVHINPDLPDTTPKVIAAYLKAFCLAQDWLVKAHEVDLSRRITPYIDLFPAAYVACVLDYSADVTLPQLIDDYTQFNPTRNRALDMTPLFKHLDEPRLTAAIDDDRINARPTFHYRLPNCSLEQPGWSLASSWNIWCVIEHLAQRPTLINEMSRQWQQRKENLITLDEPSWHQILDQIYQDLLSA